MKCPTCVKEGATSKVYVTGSGVTNPEVFYDEAGNGPHAHRTEITELRCDGNHPNVSNCFTHARKMFCSACGTEDWQEETT